MYIYIYICIYIYIYISGMYKERNGPLFPGCFWNGAGPDCDLNEIPRILKCPNFYSRQGSIEVGYMCRDEKVTHRINSQSYCFL